MSKKTTETKTEKQAVKNQPIELTEEQLEGAHGGAGSAARKSGSVVACDFNYKA